FLSYYRKELIEKPINEIELAYSKLNKLKKFEQLKKPILKRYSTSQLSYIEEKLMEEVFRPRLSSSLSEKELINFLIENKQEIKKDNTRDFIIWINTLEICEKFKSDQIFLISNDKIFHENEILKSNQSK